MSPQSVMQQPGMAPAPQEGGPAGGMSPDQMAIFDQMRQNISPKEFGDEMLAGAAQVDPEAVNAFKQELDDLDVPMDILNSLNDLVDEVLANPEAYDQIRQKYMSQGIPEDILPEEFDPQFFAALNMAVDQMIAAPAGPQAFAKGGIAELKPIAKAIASYGRDGDTMLAHITPAEARMLKRRGGAGSINPVTGLPEFRNIFKKIGSAVKKFASSTVGKVVLTVALGFFLGPAAASLVGATSAAGVAAVSGFVGAAGSTALGGGSIRDSLKAGVIGGLTAGAGAAVMGGSAALQAGSYTGPTTIGGQYDSLMGNAPAAAPGAAPGAVAPPVDAAQSFPVPESGALPAVSPDPMGDFMQQNEAARSAAGKNALTDSVTTSAQREAAAAATKGGTSLADRAVDFYKGNISPSGIQEAGTQSAMSKTMAQFPGSTAEQIMNAPVSTVLGKAYEAALPGTLATYGPMAAAGLGIMGVAGGFKSSPVQGGEITESLMTSPIDRMRKEGTESRYYVQGLPGVKYNSKGEPIPGEFLPLPTLPDLGSFAPPTSIDNPIGAGLPIGSTYQAPAETIGSRQVAQPYNTSSMYTNLRPRGLAYGGNVSGIAGLAQGGYPRMNGQISGPGTEKSDDIPAMLSDGEFVMTAKAVRGAGKGSRREGAKKMYKLMHQLETNSTRG